MADVRGMPPARNQLEHVLPLVSQVWRDGSTGREEAQVAWRRGCVSEKASGRTDAGQHRPKRLAGQLLLTRRQRRDVAQRSVASARRHRDEPQEAATTLSRGRPAGVRRFFAGENLDLIADISVSGLRAARELDALTRPYGIPKQIVSDNRTEFKSRATLNWQYEAGVVSTISHRASQSRTASWKT